MEIDWGELVPNPVSPALTVYRNRHKIQGLWKKLLALTDLGSTNVLILGKENVGKTIFLDYLNGKTSDPFYEKPSTSTIAEREAVKVGSWHSLIRTAPGQESLARDQTIDSAFGEDDSLEGVIYLCDWGYTNLRSKVNKSVFTDQHGINSIADLRQKMLEIELKNFDKVIHDLEKEFRKGKTIKWFLTVVTKADLFYSKNELREAMNYYHPQLEGIFGKKIWDFSGGGKLFKVDALPISSYREDFIWNEEIVMSNIGSIDNQNNLVRMFYEKVLELRIS